MKGGIHGALLIVRIAVGKLGSCRGACRFNFVSSNYAEEEFKCPPSKLYAHEYIFSKAISKGIVNSTDWDPDSSHTILPSLRFK